MTLLPSHRAPPAKPTDPDQGLFRPVLVKNGQNRLKLGSLKCDWLVCLVVLGMGSVAGSQVTNRVLSNYVGFFPEPGHVRRMNALRIPRKSRITPATSLSPMVESPVMLGKRKTDK